MGKQTLNIVLIDHFKVGCWTMNFIQEHFEGFINQLCCHFSQVYSWSFSETCTEHHPSYDGLKQFCRCQLIINKQQLCQMRYYFLKMFWYSVNMKIFKKNERLLHFGKPQVLYWCFHFFKLYSWPLIVKSIKSFYHKKVS